jgi:hypothetical protein
MPLNFSLADQQIALEYWGFNLYFDEERHEWLLMSTESDYSLVGENKEEIINKAFYYLIDR